MAQESKFTLRQGFAGTITITIKDSDGDIVSLVGSPTVYFMMKNKKTDADSAALISKTTADDVTISDDSGGVITVAFTQAETAALTKNCTAEITVKYSATNVIKTRDIAVTLDKSVKIATV